MTKPAKRVCACGCGVSLEGRHPSAKYHDRQHQLNGPNSYAPVGEEERARARVHTGDLAASRLANAKLAREVEELRKLTDRLTSIHPGDLLVPDWVREPAQGKGHHAMPVLLLSDLHLDEVVNLHDMDGMNSYDRAIAEVRLERIINATIKVLRRYVSGVTLDGITVMLLGDIITGTIHPELAETNEAAPPASIVHWVPLLASALRALADEFGFVFVPVVDGNHDRTTFKTRTKKRVENSYAWVIYNWLADTLRDDPRIQFKLTTSPQQLIDVYETTFLLTHGDSFRSAGGVGGLYPSLLKYMLRMHDLYSQTKRDFDYALMGHWHQALEGQDFFVNGSLKGYDEYAKHGGFKFEKPKQQLFIVTPERGVTQRMHIEAE